MTDDGRRFVRRRRADITSRAEEICRACLTPAGVDGAGVALVTARGHRATVCATDDVAARVEEMQFVLGEGPCVDAAAARSPVFVADLSDAGEGVQDRWPGFLESAASAGVRALFAFPLRIGAISLGAMDLYRCAPGDLSLGQMRAALQAADETAVLLLDAADHALLPDVGGSRSDFRLQVHTAAGMLSVQLGTTIQQALVRLRAVAFSESRSVNAVAADVVAGRLRFGEEDS